MLLIAFIFLFAIFFIVTIFLWILKLIFKHEIFDKIILGIWLLFISLPILLIIEDIFTSKMEVGQEDIYGEYVINKNKCPGKQANWQYDHYQFEIKKDNKMYFYLLQNGRIVKPITKPIEIRDSYTSARIDIKPDEEDFHILRQNPTLYREVWSFYYVFESDKFGNMFFTKKKWWQ